MADDCSASIFTTGAGRVVAIESDNPLLFTLTIAATDNITSFYPQFKSIVTGVAVRAQGGYQFLHTLSDFIYMYVFNERVGEIIVSGLAFAGTCEDNDPVTGLEHMITWYDTERATNRKTPVIITFGTTVSFTSFLTSMQADLNNPETGIAQFAMHFNFIPRGANIRPCEQPEFRFDTEFQPESTVEGETTQAGQTTAEEEGEAEFEGEFEIQPDAPLFMPGNNFVIGDFAPPASDIEELPGDLVIGFPGNTYTQIVNP